MLTCTDGCFRPSSVSLTCTIANVTHYCESFIACVVGYRSKCCLIDCYDSIWRIIKCTTVSNWVEMCINNRI